MCGVGDLKEVVRDQIIQGFNSNIFRVSSVLPGTVLGTEHFLVIKADTILAPGELIFQRRGK